jgi:hypothetical protein
MKAIERILETHDEVMFVLEENGWRLAVFPNESGEVRDEYECASMCVHAAANDLNIEVSECEDIDGLTECGVEHIFIEKYNGDVSNELVIQYLKRCDWTDIFNVSDKMKNANIFYIFFKFSTRYGQASSCAYSHSVDDLINTAIEMLESPHHLPDDISICDAITSCTDY